MSSAIAAMMLPPLRARTMPSESPRITQLLQSTNPAAADELLRLVYEQLRKKARERLSREKPGQTLQPTALVHEAFLRLTGGSGSLASFENRRHFFGAAAEAMRRILIDQAQRRARIRHGGNAVRVNFDDVDLCIAEPEVDVLAVDEALRALEAADPRAREVVNLRFFVGLTVPETADVLGVSVSTVEREWRFVRTFLQEELDGDVEA